MIYFTSDIHGNSRGLLAGLQSIGLITADGEVNKQWEHQLYICGDMVDRGPDTNGVLSLLIRIKNEHPTCLFPIMGNHDWLMLQAKNKPLGNFEDWIMWMSGEATLESYGAKVNLYTMDSRLTKAIPQEHYDFISGLPAIRRVTYGGKRLLFCHAGLHPDGDLSTNGNKPNDPHDLSVLWIREGFYANDKNEFISKQYQADLVIFGHSPTSGAFWMGNNPNKLDMQRKISPKWCLDNKALCIDTGSGYMTGKLTISQITEAGEISIAFQEA